MIWGKPSLTQRPAPANRSEPGLNTHEAHHSLSLSPLVWNDTVLATTAATTTITIARIFVPSHRHWQGLIVHIFTFITQALPWNRDNPDDESQENNLQTNHAASWYAEEGIPASIGRRRHFSGNESRWWFLIEVLKDFCSIKIIHVPLRKLEFKLQNYRSDCELYSTVVDTRICLSLRITTEFERDYEFFGLFFLIMPQLQKLHEISPNYALITKFSCHFGNYKNST